MLLDLSPLRRHRDFRLVFVGQLVSAFGGFLTYVALPVQIYELTKSSWAVGMVGTVQLVPLAVTSLWGGAVADALDRGKSYLPCRRSARCATPEPPSLDRPLPEFASRHSGCHSRLGPTR